MKSNELIIGQTYMSVKWRKAVSLTAEDIHELVERAEGADISHYINQIFKPIPLTEEWLLKFGFVERAIGHNDFGMNVVYEIQNIEVIHYNDGTFYVSIFDNDIHLEYVNQLQNLYFALTGEELTN